MFFRRKRNDLYDRLISPVLLTQQLLLNNEYAEKLLDQIKPTEDDSIRTWSKETLPFISVNRAFDRAIQKRYSTKKTKRSRLIQKNGECNVFNINVPRKERQYIRDIFTTLIDVPWRYILILFSSGFVLSWTFFAIIYYIICYVHKDFENFKKPGWKPCVVNVYDFVSVFLFSVESQHTIGYGSRYTTTNCSAAITTLCIQAIAGLLIQSFMAGLVFAKIARPAKRAMTLIFSKQACVSLRDGQLCFLFRVGDMRNTHLVESHIRLQLIRKRTTEEGETLPLQQYDMDVGFDCGVDRIFLVWPITVCHMITQKSPLYEYSAEELLTAQFEIIVLLEGIVESTGMTAQARTSYLPAEITWGHRFETLVTYQKQNGEYQIDYGRFHNTYKVSVPRCSAKELEFAKGTGCNIGSQFYCSPLVDDDCQDSDTVTASSVSRNSFDVSNGDLFRRPFSQRTQLPGDKPLCLSPQMISKHKTLHGSLPTSTNLTPSIRPPEILVISPSTTSLSNTSGNSCEKRVQI